MRVHKYSTKSQTTICEKITGKFAYELVFKFFFLNTCIIT